MSRRIIGLSLDNSKYNIVASYFLKNYNIRMYHLPLGSRDNCIMTIDTGTTILDVLDGSPNAPLIMIPDKLSDGTSIPWGFQYRAFQRIFQILNRDGEGYRTSEGGVISNKLGYVGFKLPSRILNTWRDSSWEEVIDELVVQNYLSHRVSHKKVIGCIMMDELYILTTIGTFEHWKFFCKSEKLSPLWVSSNNDNLQLWMRDKIHETYGVFTGTPISVRCKRKNKGWQIII